MSGKMTTSPLVEEVPPSSNNSYRRGSDSAHYSNISRSRNSCYSTDSTPPDPADAEGRKSVLMGAAAYIIVTEFCERLAYVGFAGSLVLFFETRMGMSNVEADIQYSAWAGACYLTPLVGGYIADTYLGRYRTILVFCLVYLLGLALMVFGCVPGNSTPAIVFPAMYIIAIGTGGIKPNVCTLGADQFDMRYSADRREKESFFNWFYWSINSASLISLTLVAYICQNGLSGLGGEDWGFFIGYAIPCVALSMALAAFASGHSAYKLHPPNGSVLGTAFSIAYEALWTRRHVQLGGGKGGIRRPSGHSQQDNSHGSSPTTTRAAVAAVTAGGATPIVSMDAADKRDVRYSSNTAHDILGGSSFRSKARTTPSAQSASSSRFDLAKKRYGGSFDWRSVEGVKMVVRLVPFLAALVPFWGLYSQMSTAFQNQACQMSLDMGGGERVPISALQLFDCLAIVLLVPVFDGFVYPQLKVCGYRVSMLQKLGAGFCVALSAMVVAALTEQARLAAAPAPGDYYDVSARDNITPCQSIDDYNPYNYQKWQAGIDDTEKPEYCWQSCGLTYQDGSVTLLNMTCIDCDDIPQMSSLSIFWQIPQFSLVGISEILAAVTAIEFFYSQAPLSMRSVCQSLNLLTTALGTWLTIPLLVLVNLDSSDEWVPANVDNGHLDWFFLLLAALMGLNLLYFWYVSQGYVYVKEEQLRRLEAKPGEPWGTSGEGGRSGGSGDSGHAGRGSDARAPPEGQLSGQGDDDDTDEDEQEEEEEEDTAALLSTAAWRQQ